MNLPTQGAQGKSISKKISPYIISEKDPRWKFSKLHVNLHLKTYFFAILGLFRLFFFPEKLGHGKTSIYGSITCLQKSEKLINRYWEKLYIQKNRFSGQLRASFTHFQWNKSSKNMPSVTSFSRIWDFKTSQQKKRNNNTNNKKHKKHMNSLSKTRYKDRHTAIKLIPTEDGTTFRKVFAKYLLSKKVFSLITY